MVNKFDNQVAFHERYARSYTHNYNIKRLNI